MDAALASWVGICTRAPIPVRALGYADRDEFYRDVERLRRAVGDERKISEADTAKVLFCSVLVRSSGW
ncbi:hypothetical protein [Nocardia sp. AG03]|uniref:hypothetical protein n=1 Tax=Nocardia sp. AG03 TaxID=3025312 RepID=UPI002418B355|nr:hypothetical protein [Nocardia sp. AG03]